MNQKADIQVNKLFVAVFAAIFVVVVAYGTSTKRQLSKIALILRWSKKAMVFIGEKSITVSLDNGNTLVFEKNENKEA